MEVQILMITGIVLMITGIVVITIITIRGLQVILGINFWKGDYSILNKCIIKDKEGVSYKVTHICTTIDELELTSIKRGTKIWVSGIREILKNKHKTHRIARYNNGERYV